ncbi:MAG: phosphoserine phosphatase SerB [Alphaproteobacteria bacterium]
MDFALILAAAPGALDDSTVHALSRALQGAGIGAGAPNWLAPGEACEFPVAQERDVEAATRAVLGARPIDVAVMARADRRKRILVADMDSTVVQGESLDELAAHAGVKDKVAALTARAMNAELPYGESLRRRVALLAGLSTTAIGTVLDRLELTPGAKILAATMRANGAHAVLVTSGFAEFSSAVRVRAGFDADISNALEIADGKLTGRVREPILDRDGKAAAMRAIAARLGRSTADVLAVGDGANDLGMILEAGLGVAFHAKPTVAAQARVRVEHADLTALLYIQGYRKSEFRTN